MEEVGRNLDSAEDMENVTVVEDILLFAISTNNCSI